MKNLNMTLALQGDPITNFSGSIYPIEMNYFYPAEKSLGGGSKHCHEKACHCVGGEYWLYGGATRNGYQNETDLAFGRQYRNLYGEFIRTGNVQKFLKPWDPNDSRKRFNFMDGSGITFEPLFEEECDLNDQFDHYLTI